VTGIINIDNIPYANKCDLEARYPEIKINAQHIIGTITLIENELDMPKIFNIDLGSTDKLGTTIDISKIIPKKESTQKHEYTFANWVYNNGQS
jgi:hypothetical protein